VLRHECRDHGQKKAPLLAGLSSPASYDRCYLLAELSSCGLVEAVVDVTVMSPRPPARKSRGPISYRGVTETAIPIGRGRPKSVLQALGCWGKP
jgi:hypothetical protein